MTIAGTGIAEYNGDEIPAVEAGLNGPADISADDSGNVYIADAYNHRVRRVDSAGVIHTDIRNAAGALLQRQHIRPATSLNIGNPKTGFSHQETSPAACSMR